MKDGYKDVLSHFNIIEEDFINVGSLSIIDASIKMEQAKKEWESLIKRVESELDDSIVYVRSYGRGNYSEVWAKFLKEIFPNANLKEDETNNLHPKKLIQKLTDYSNKKYKSEKHTHIKLLVNYRVSHVFGKTKNPFAFTAPWNIVYLPVIFDPLTGHESSGELTLKFSKLLKSMIYIKFEENIKQFNDLMLKIEPAINIFIEANEANLPKGMKDEINRQFSPINNYDFM